MIDEPIATTKDRPGSYDAIATAKADEPLFPIQGGDPFGPPTVLHWVGLARASAMRESDPKTASALLQKATDAEMIAWSMMAYQRGEQEIEGRRAAYADSGYGDETSDERKLRETRIRGAGQLNNAVAIVTDVADQLERLMACLPEVAELREAMERVKAAAITIEPRRGRERS